MTIIEKPLGNIASVIMGLSPKGDTYNKEGEGIPLLNGPTEFGDIYPNCTIFTTDSKRECKKGNLLFCVRGSTTGRMNWTDKVYSLGRGVCSITGETSLDTKYIRYCLELKLDALLKNAGGGTFPNLRKDDLLNFRIPYPTCRDKIASILSAYDDLIENNNRRIKILEEMAQAIYKEWFIKFRFPGHEKVKMVKSEMGMIPEGWEVKKLGKIIDFQKGKKAKIIYESLQPEAIPYLLIEGIKNRCFLYTDDEKMAIAKNDDIIMVMDGASSGQVFIGFHGAVGSTLGIYKVKKDMNYSPYIVYFFLKDNYKSISDKNIGSAIPHANKEYIATMDIIPDQKTNGMFDRFARKTFNQIDVLQRKNLNLRKTRDRLLPKLIGGEIDIENLDIKQNNLEGVV